MAELNVFTRKRDYSRNGTRPGRETDYLPAAVAEIRSKRRLSQIVSGQERPEFSRSHFLFNEAIDGRRA
jgi:hypothetical protein